MKLKLDKQTAQSLTNLRASPDFRQVLKWLDQGRTAARDQCQAAEGPVLFRAQGAATCLSSILENAGKAPAVTDKFKQ